jgi:hypothetical protein
MRVCLNIGGLIAAGFEPSGRHLLTVSHSGRGVYLVDGWVRVARDSTIYYPEDEQALGIGPIEGLIIAVTEINHETGELHTTSPDGAFRLDYDSGLLYIASTNA